MSNCISIWNESVTFREKEMDLVGLLAALREHRQCKGFDVHGGWRRAEAQEWACSMAQWFLVEGKNLHVQRTGAQMTMKVVFGRGKSSHTWRDFQSTVLFLNQFMKSSKSHVFQICDTDAGCGTDRSVVVFSPGEKKKVFLRDWELELAAVEAELAAQKPVSHQ